MKISNLHLFFPELGENDVMILLNKTHRKCTRFITFLSNPGVPGVRSMDPDVRPSVRQTPFADLPDVTLADEDSNSISTDDVNGAILGNVTMQVAPSGGQIYNQCK